ALWDLRGKLVGLPVCKLLGSQRHARLPAYVSGLPKPTIPERADLAKSWLDKGFNAFKFASAVSHDGIVTEMEALRKAAGNEANILIDMHWKFTAAEAISLITRLEAYNLYVAEAPVKPEDIKGQALVVRSVKTPVAIGEELRTVYEYRPRFEEGCMHVIQPEMGRTGITSFWNICQMAVAFNQNVMPHASIGMGIFQAASLHASASLPNLVYHEYQHSIFDKNLPYLRGNMRCEEGFFYLPDGPGLGVEPRDELFNFLKK
ncbi:MAG: mandelate racemase/muconate lactonizing enzyme family protein, partial [Ferruginibacter sp.]|nr:mandelate racemase/muconate lactonizing enzyme family protein [Cytophagales bacterium]